MRTAFTGGVPRPSNLRSKAINTITAITGRTRIADITIIHSKISFCPGYRVLLAF